MGELVLGDLGADVQERELALLGVDHDPLPVRRHQALEQVHGSAAHPAEALQQLRQRRAQVGRVRGVDRSPHRQLALAVQVRAPEQPVHRRAGVGEVADHLLERRERRRVPVRQPGLVQAGDEVAHALRHHAQDHEHVVAVHAVGRYHEQQG